MEATSALLRATDLGPRNSIQPGGPPLWRTIPLRVGSWRPTPPLRPRIAGWASVVNAQIAGGISAGPRWLRSLIGWPQGAAGRGAVRSSGTSTLGRRSVALESTGRQANEAKADQRDSKAYFPSHEILLPINQPERRATTRELLDYGPPRFCVHRLVEEGWNSCEANQTLLKSRPVAT